MKKLTTTLLIPLLLAVLSSCTVKQIQTATRTVTVQGSGEIELKADTATVTMAVNTRNADVLKASQDNAARVESVINAITAEGVEKYNISTVNYNIYQDSSSYINGRLVAGQYNVSNQIRVVLRDTSAAGSIIDAAIKAGANELSSLTYSVSNTEEAVRQARMLAIKQAEENASVLASSNAATLGQILSITENTGSLYPRAKGMEADAALLSSATPVFTGNTSVTVTVTATWELK